MSDGYLDYQQLAATSLRMRDGMTTVALGVVSIIGGALALPELVTLTGIASVLGSFSAIGSLAGGAAEFGIGVVQISGATVSGEDAKFVAGMANPVGAAMVAIAAPTGEQNVKAAVELSEWTFRLMELGNVISSPPHTPEVLGPVITIVGQPIGGMFLDGLGDDSGGRDPRPLDTSVTPVLNNLENPVTTPATDGSIDNAAGSSTESNDAGEDQGGGEDSGSGDPSE
jgi:hypothetical protein